MNSRYVQEIRYSERIGNRLGEFLEIKYEKEPYEKVGFTSLSLKKGEKFESFLKLTRELFIYKPLEKEEGEPLFVVSIPPPTPPPSVISVKRLSEILENVSNEEFTPHDAETFIEIGPRIKQLPHSESLMDMYEKIREVYTIKLPLLPVLASDEGILIISLLNERPFESAELKKIVKDLYPLFNPISYELAIKALLKRGLINHYRVGFFKRIYEITERGKIAAILIRKRYRELVNK